MFYAGKSAGSRNLVSEHLRGKWSMLIQCEVYEFDIPRTARVSDMMELV